MRCLRLNQEDGRSHILCQLDSLTVLLNMQERLTLPWQRLVPSLHLPSVSLQLAWKIASSAIYISLKEILRRMDGLCYSTYVSLTSRIVPFERCTNLSRDGGFLQFGSPSKENPSAMLCKTNVECIVVAPGYRLVREILFATSMSCRATYLY